MKNLQIYFFIISLLAISCQPSSQLNEQKVEETLTSEAAKSHWKETGNAETIGALSELQTNTKDLVTERQKHRITAEDTVAIQHPPVFNKKELPEVEFRAAPGVSTYKGQFHIDKMENGMIQGKIDGGGDCSIYYQFPEHDLPKFAKVDSDVSLFYEEEFVSGSLNKALMLSTDRHPLVLSVEEGSDQPFVKRFPDLNLVLRQIVGNEKEGNGVQIQYGNQRFSLTEGQKVRRRGPGGEIEFFLITSFVKPASILEEGQNYYVRLYAYAL